MNEHQISLFSSKKSDCWRTPKHIIEELTEEFGFLFDPCPIDPKIDGLSIDWETITYVNPPYSNVKEWLEYAHKQLEKGNCKTIIFLTFANTDTKWFHDLVYNKAEIRFIKGRLKFKDYNNKERSSAMRPSILIIFRK